jgi:hypothetical protein
MTTDVRADQTQIELSQLGLVRADWVGVHKAWLGMPNVPGTNPTFGALALYDNGVVEWRGKRANRDWYKPWHSSIDAVSNARHVTTYWPYGPGKYHLRANFGDGDWTLYFTGTKPDVKLSPVENAAMHLPVRHTFGLGAIYAVGKLSWKQRGSKQRAIESCEAWLQLLSHQIDPEVFHSGFVTSEVWRDYPYGVEGSG